MQGRLLGRLINHYFRHFRQFMLAIPILAGAPLVSATAQVAAQIDRASVTTRSLGTFDAVPYVEHTFVFRGKADVLGEDGERREVGYRTRGWIWAPADPAQANGRVLVDIPNTIGLGRLGERHARETVLGRDLLFGRGHLIAAVRWELNTMDVEAGELLGPLDGPRRAGLSILDDFAEALRSNQMVDLTGAVTEVYSWLDLLGRDNLPEIGPSPDLELPRPPEPSQRKLHAAADAVIVNWLGGYLQNETYDYLVQRRDRNGEWITVHKITQPPVGSNNHFWTDVDHSDHILHCYRILAWWPEMGTGKASNEQCTVRPDARWFPQDIPSAAKEWIGPPSSTAESERPGRSGMLYNETKDEQLFYASRVGINLRWRDRTEHNITVRRRQGLADFLMCGEPVALRVADGGWLYHARRTWGIDLRFSNTPQYEWHILCEHPGDAIEVAVIGVGPAALWNAEREAFLVYGSRTPGVDLRWYEEPAPTENTSTVWLQRQQVIEGNIPYLGRLGPIHGGRLTKIQNPQLLNTTLSFVRPGQTTQECGNPSAVVQLAPGQEMAPTDIETIYGTSQPSLWPQAIYFLTCIGPTAGQLPHMVPINITYVREP